MVELQRMRWYNPKDGTFEWREVPKSDEDALALLSSSSYTQRCTDTYRYWRGLDASIAAALIRAGEQAIEEGSQEGVS
jgi:hypothetical protein